MNKILILVFLALASYHASAQNVTKFPADTIIAGSIEKSCPGGFAGFNEYIKKHIHPSMVAIENHNLGTTYVSFIIELDGSVSNVCTILAAGDGMDQEAIRVIKLSNSWTPAELNGKPVRSFCRAGIQLFADYSNNTAWLEARKVD